MEIEDRIVSLLDRVDNHPKTWQKGHYGSSEIVQRSGMRVKSNGPCSRIRYNDADVAEGIGVTIREAISNLETKVERLLV